MTILNSSLRLMSAIGMCLLIGACSDSSNNKNTDTDGSSGEVSEKASLAGTAAVGAAIVNATVTATCQDGSGFTISPVKTDTNGKWSAKVESAQLPCLLELKQGTPDIELSSMAFTEGTVNITPLTHLALAIAGTDAQFSWKEDKIDWPTQLETESAINTLVQNLKDKGYADSALSGNPFNVTFDANGTGWDEVLDKLREVIEDPTSTIDSLENLTQLLADGNIGSLPDLGNTDPTDPTDPVIQSPVGSADFGSDADPTQQEFITLMTGSWPVAIYDVPESNPEWYGEGSITIGGTTDEWTLKLVGADGSVITNITSSGAFTSALTPFRSQDMGILGVTYFPGQIFINKGTAITQMINIFAEWDSGLLKGSAGGQNEVKFRNRLDAYGEGLPAIFADLAGTWTGSATVSCDGVYGPSETVTNTITISSTGEFVLDGVSQLCGAAFPKTLQWGGADDFLIPVPEATSTGGYTMHIDVSDMFNTSAAALRIRFDSDMNVTSMSGFFPELFELRSPVKN